MIKLALAFNNNQYVHVNPAHVAYVHEEKRSPFNGDSVVMATIVAMTTGKAFLVQGNLDEVVADIRGKL